jgi:hypothetical protein
VLHGGVHDHSAQARLGDELQSDRDVDRLLQQRLYAFLAQGLAQVHELRRVARPPMFEVIHPREVLPGGRLGPALNNTLVALIKGVLEIQERNHQA